MKRSVSTNSSSDLKRKPADRGFQVDGEIEGRKGLMDDRRPCFKTGTITGKRRAAVRWQGTEALPQEFTHPSDAPQRVKDVDIGCGLLLWPFRTMMGAGKLEGIGGNRSQSDHVEQRTWGGARAGIGGWLSDRHDFYVW